RRDAQRPAAARRNANMRPEQRRSGKAERRVIPVWQLAQRERRPAIPARQLAQRERYLVILF
ncbi:MAG TPA: hypothetical protein VMQ67_12910, partial [Candidatus Saccharimonadales bacterium]|nr:hypothetical protein [Candidatus Saccharimonadales bacterium]